MSTLLNRRQWLKAAGATIAASAVTGRVPLQAQSAGPSRPAADAVPGLIQLCWNENPFGPATSAQAAMRAAIGRSCRYPDLEEQELLKLIAAREGCPVDRIVLGNGSGEILEAAGSHFGYQHGEIVAADPCYMQLLQAADRAGGKAVRVPLNSRMEHDLPAMAAAVGPRTSLVYVVNPNNPTGTVCEAAELKEFVRTVSARVPVFIDEAYLECTDDFAGRTCMGLVNAGHNVVVARTFSKIFGMAGCRLGYAVLPAPLAAPLRARMTGSLSLSTIVAGIASLQDAAYVDATREKIRAGRKALTAVARSLGRECTAAQGNFVFLHTGLPVQEFVAKMRAEGVLVGRAFPPLLDWARITVGLPEEMEVCHRALRKVLA